ncbi:MAG TPA: FHA domain-containing protein, partial [Lachnospiraceae bacterium]|nr:FHA domain-containing protein [Lachnospiraceae bacterium]
MQIGFFICNCETAEELIYSGPQLEKIKEAGRGSFLVEKERFGISESVEILFTWDGKSVDFLLHEKGSCRFFEDGKIIRNKCFSEQCFFTIVTAKREKFWLSLIFYNTVKAKIYLTKQNVDVGRGAKNTICCVGDRFISDLHLRIRKKEGTAEAAVEGRNGIYINRRYIGRHGKCRLYFGDEICFFSWKIIWLDSLLAVYSGAGQDVSAALLKYTGAESINVLAPAGRKGAGKDKPEQVFSPSPRNYPVLNREAVELEFPPEKREEEKQPLFLTIGPAFTMALPMLAGFGSVILISRSQDNRSGTFLYMGIITAVTSAFLGVFWGIMNVRQRQKRIRQAEGQRQNAYLKYAADC